MSNDQTKYDLFISYARLDNRPIPETYPYGWVTALMDFILMDQRRNSTEKLRIFFDTSEIRDMDDWLYRILGALRSSKVLLICLSPNYFKSDPCRWEWNEYMKWQTHQLIGMDSVATVYFVDAPGSDEQENARWLETILRYNFADIRPWFANGPQAVQDPEVRRRMGALGLSLWERIDRARRARQFLGNVRRTNPCFVGRWQELSQLHVAVGVGATGTVTVIHGLGGLGKTELAFQYANGFAYCYPGGLWSIPADGYKELLPLLGKLAYVPQFGLGPTDDQKDNPERLGRVVLEKLRIQCESLNVSNPDHGAAALIIMDNVSEPELLGVGQLANLPHPADWLRLIATTRLGPDRFAKSEKQLTLVPVDALSVDDALELVREHQPDQRFANPAEEAATREIVQALGGFTLAIEHVAIYLGLNAAYDPPSAYLQRLEADGLARVAGLGIDVDFAANILHREKQINPVLRATLDPLIQELPPALTLLKFAALLPHDTIPWPWLQELTLAHHPELVASPSNWGKLRRRVEELRLLTPGHMPEVARIHRLIAAHLAESMLEPQRSEFIERIREVVAKRLEGFRSWRGQLFYEIRRGNAGQGAADWYVAPIDEVRARAQAGSYVNFIDMNDGSFVLTLKPGLIWEEQCFHAFCGQQFSDESADAIEWALQNGEVSDTEIHDAQERMERLYQQNPEGVHEGKIYALYLLVLAAAYGRMGFARSPYSLATQSVTILQGLRERHPTDAIIATLLQRAFETQWAYDW